MSDQARWRVVVAGATGFTGALAAHLVWRHPGLALTGRADGQASARGCTTDARDLVRHQSPPGGGSRNVRLPPNAGVLRRGMTEDEARS